MPKFLTSGLFSIALAITGLSTTPAHSNEPPLSVTLSYERGQVLTLAAALNAQGEDAREARATYFQTVARITGDQGLSRDLTFRTTETAVGSLRPAGFSFISWPSAEAEAVLNAHPDWAPTKALRPTAWQDLRLFTVVLDQDIDLTFQSDRAYTVAVASIDPQAPEDYDAYLDAIEPTLTQMGARFVYKMRDTRFEATPASDDAERQVTFVEWQSAEDLESFQQSEGFLSNYALLQSGTVGFELHLIEPILTPDS